jgi:hypothetical protein
MASQKPVASDQSKKGDSEVSQKGNKNEKKDGVADEAEGEDGEQLKFSPEEEAVS